eukprot:CAMPEP_0113307294 /NCGR_PEP_ID=MMETSP0010_2-20120614/6200_1 /TAXON_ID=216773 ORGANISM="Corethron hystrix, Strain 308" /NCGR_SAMPLE_ID=MMETSP0010_2 /ASSEMBLY_ACC=CAM_ASM_000155 /LENGTH=279 /DNA_ID=CAMNT_0000162127 /DNA_START=155 /DNA_END=991 /DNA_ORIENTATION=+ /assembly_acc=CAM_ASM_000155
MSENKELPLKEKDRDQNDISPFEVDFSSVPPNPVQESCNSDSNQKGNFNSDQIGNDFNPRLRHWFFLAICSGITITASANNAMDGSVEERWASTCSSVSTVLAAILAHRHYARKPTSIDDRVMISSDPGRPIEGAAIVLLSACWTAVVVTSTGIGDAALNADGTIRNANLYYFAWASFIECLSLATSFVSELYLVDKSITGDVTSAPALSEARRFSLWCGMAVATALVAGSCADNFHSICRVDSLNEVQMARCAKTTFGMSMGIVCMGFVVIMVHRKVW